MAFLDSLPESLRNRLLAAGVSDHASLYAALEADPKLRDAYQQWLFSEVIQRFAQTEHREALLALADEVPMIMEDEFLNIIQRGINKALDIGEYDTAEALRQRLDALKEIRAMKAYQRQTPLVQAVIAFVQARSDIAARRVYERYQNELDSDEAEAFLREEFEGSSEAADQHLAQRRALLQALRAESRD